MKQYVVLSGFFQEFKYGKTVPGLHLNRLVEDILRENGYPTKGCTPCAQPNICDLLTDCSLGGGTTLPDGAEGDILFFNGTDWVVLNAGNDNQLLGITSGWPAWQTRETLPPGSSGQVLYHNGTGWVTLSAGADGAFFQVSGGLPSWQLRNFITAPPSPATGDILYYNGTTWARLAIGTAGRTLQVSGGIPSWGDPTLPGGTFTPSVSYSNSSSFTEISPEYTTAGNFVLYGWRGTITPTASGNVTITITTPASLGGNTLNYSVVTGVSADQNATNLSCTVTQVGTTVTVSFTVANTNVTNYRIILQGGI